MSNGRRSMAGVVGVAALVSVALAACDPSTNSHGERRMQARLHAEEAVPRPAAPPQPLRAQLDAASGRVWTLHVDGVDVRGAMGARTTTAIRLPGWTWAAEPYACPPDLAVVRDGAVLVTSNVTPAIWRIDPATLEVTRHDLAVAENTGKDVGFSRLFYSARYEALFAASALDNSLWHVDRSLTRAQRIAVSPSLPQGCVLSVLPASAQNSLCLQIEHDDWIVTLSADLRSGDANPAKCPNERPEGAGFGKS